MGLTERSFLERMELMGLTPSITNADRIRAMTDDQLAMLLDQTQLSGYRFGVGLDYPKRNGAYDWLMWLKEEVADDSGYQSQ